MKNFSILVLSVIFLSGCSAVGTVATQNSLTTTTTYDKDGRIINQIQEQKPVLDTQSEYQLSVRSVAESNAKAVKAKADAISTTMVAVQKDKNIGPVGKALLAYMGMQSLGNMQTINPATIAAIQRSMSGYELIADFGGKLVSGAMWGFIGHEAAGVLKGAYDAAGNRTDINVSGDNNKVTAENRKITSTIHANTTGDNSPSTVTNSPENGCKTGNCGKDSETDTPEGDSCLNDPSITQEFLDAIPGNCSSVASYCAGRCSVKP